MQPDPSKPDPTDRDVEKELADYDKRVDEKSGDKIGKPKDFTNPDGVKIPGYREQSQATLGVVKFHKEWEERVLRHFDWLNTHEGIDRRWLSIAKTHIEQGFMAVNRALLQPGRIDLPEDADQDTLPSNQLKRW